MSDVTTHSTAGSRETGQLILTASGRVIYRGRHGATTIASDGSLAMDLSDGTAVLFTPSGVTFSPKRAR